MLPFPYKQILTIFLASIYVVYSVNIVYTTIVRIDVDSDPPPINNICATRRFVKPLVQAQSAHIFGCVYCSNWTNFTCAYANSSGNGVVTTDATKWDSFANFVCLPFNGTYDRGIDVNCTMYRIKT